MRHFGGYCDTLLGYCTLALRIDFEKNTAPIYYFALHSILMLQNKAKISELGKNFDGSR